MVVNAVNGISKLWNNAPAVKQLRALADELAGSVSAENSTRAVGVAQQLLQAMGDPATQPGHLWQAWQDLDKQVSSLLRRCLLPWHTYRRRKCVGWF